MQLIGPLHTRKNLNLIAFEESTISIIKLGIKASFIFSLNHQLPFFYSSYFERLLETSIEELKNTFKTQTLTKKEIKSIEIVKSKVWAHKVIIHSNNKEFKFAIQKREEVDNYIQILNNWKARN